MKHLKEFESFGIVGKATAEGNIIIENILEREELKLQKNEDEHFNFLCKIGTDCKF